MRTAVCRHCGISFDYHPYAKTGTYCSNRCSGDAKLAASRAKFEAGESLDRPIQKRFVLERDGHQCKVCQLTEWLGQSIPLDLDHADGNAGNQDPQNLRLLCPNCHRQTPFYGAKNKGAGRKSRGLPTR